MMNQELKHEQALSECKFTRGVFVTMATAKWMVGSMKNIKDADITGDVYKRPIYFFSQYEKKELLLIKQLFAEPNSFFETYYKQQEADADTLEWVDPPKLPSYHLNHQCSALNSDYKNYKIPEQIREKGSQVVWDYRNWFKTVQYLLERGDVDAFIARLFSRWGIAVRVSDFMSPNSGLMLKNEYEIDELTSTIDALIRDAGRFYYATEKNNTILKRYSKASHLAYVKGELSDNETGYTDEEVKSLLEEYDKKFKKPLKTLLVEYFRLTLNQDLKLHETKLIALGLRKCKRCSESKEINTPVEFSAQMKESSSTQEESYAHQ